MEAGQLQYLLQRRGVRREALVVRMARRGLDIGVASVVLVLSAPILILIALTIRYESSGAAIFRQRRIGVNGHSFTVNKFRTMRSGADPAPIAPISSSW